MKLKSKVNRKSIKAKNKSNSKNNINKNIREIELSSENIRVVKPDKETNANKGKKAAKKAASKKTVAKRGSQNKKVSKKKANKAKKPANPKVMKLIKWTTILIIIIGIAIFICTTPIFNIQEIEVTGISKLTKNEVISLSQIKREQNIFKYNKKEISDSISENPYVKEVTVKKKYPSKIELIIEERQKVACVKILNSYAYIDSEGYILEISEEREGLAIIEGIKTEEINIKAGKRLVEDDLEQLSLALKIIEVSKNKGIQEELYSINIKNDEFVMHLENNKKLIYLGDASNLINRIDAVKEAIRKIPEKQGRLYAHGNLNNNFELYFKEGEI